MTERFVFTGLNDFKLNSGVVRQYRHVDHGRLETYPAQFLKRRQRSADRRNTQSDRFRSSSFLKGWPGEQETGNLRFTGEVPKWSYRARLEIELGTKSLYVGSNPTLSASSFQPMPLSYGHPICFYQAGNYFLAYFDSN